jgi:hypothetical protein
VIDRESGAISAAHLAAWRSATIAYLAAPAAAAGAALEAEDAVSHPVSHRRIGRGVLLSWAVRALLHMLGRAARHEDNPLRVLESAFRFQVAFMAKHPAVPRRLLAWHAQTDDPHVRRRIRRAIGRFEGRIARLILLAGQRGQIAQGIDARTAAALFVGMIQGLALRMNAGFSHPSLLAREADNAFAVYLRGIGGAGGSNSAAPA